MSDRVIVTGMVLSASAFNEYDKRIVILTKERGKITAFARGAKRPGSQLMAAANPFCFGEFELGEGKNAYTLYKASISNYFRELTADPPAAYMGFYFLEFASYFCQENNDEKEMLKLLYQSLRALISPVFSNRLVRSVFELKAMAINGQGPDVFSCCRCRRKELLHTFSVRDGGAVCDHCKVYLGGIPVSDACLYAMQYVLSTRTEKIYSFTLKEEVQKELAALMKDYLDNYLHHSFKSLEILDSLALDI